MFRIQVFRYRYREPPPAPSSCVYLESPQDIHTLSSSPNPHVHSSPYNNSPQNLILIRERGGASDNHVQWISAEQIEPITPYRGTSFAHGIVRRANWVNEVGQMVWVRSDQALMKGRGSCPAVNLALLKSVEVRIGDVTWQADKREKADAGRRRDESMRDCGGGNARLGNRGREPDCFRGPLTLAGPEYRFAGARLRMCLMASGTDENGWQTGVLETLSLVDLERYYEDVGSGTVRPSQGSS
ncbi:hypothetical protein B0T14DRAFT_491776 [Immersiella caudata]|uniref:Uncharacterized protein n=1 Tax=Immersiella caudata TaxID=314043 RepID=A0AA39XHV8_9PEZI|nr:hypothetical protein B0T14DRAFT_491776 [Immersiella caudata]